MVYGKLTYIVIDFIKMSSRIIIPIICLVFIPVSIYRQTLQKKIVSLFYKGRQFNF